METKTCKSCGEQISKKAKICPHCRTKQNKLGKWIILAIIILFIGACCSNFAKSQEEEKNNFVHNVTNEYTDSIGTHYIEGTLKNNNEKDYSYLQIEFTCYDNDGNNIGTAIANANNIGAGETWKFKAMGLFTNKDVNKCEFKEVTGW